MRTLTDKEKLGIIDSIKREMIFTIERRRKNPNWKPARKGETISFKNDFDDGSKAWLKEVFGHYGIKIDFSLGMG